MPTDQLKRHSAGRVTTSSTHDPGTLTPIRGGLFCPDIFGPWAVSEHAEDAETQVAADSRDGRWGHLELPETSVADAAYPRTVLVVAPAHRRFRKLDQAAMAMHAAQWRRRQSEAGDELQGREALEWSLWPWTRKERHIRIVEDGSTCEEFDPWPETGGGLVESPINYWYRLILELAARVERLLHLGSPPIIVQHAATTLGEAVDALFDEIETAALPAEVRRLAVARP